MESDSLLGGKTRENDPGIEKKIASLHNKHAKKKADERKKKFNEG